VEADDVPRWEASFAAQAEFADGQGRIIGDHRAMKIELESDPAVFLRRAAPFLRTEPFSGNVIAVVAARTVDGSQAPTPGDRWIVVSDDDGAVVGAGMANSPYNLFLARLPVGAARLLADRLDAEGLALPGVTGEQATARAFADRWHELRGERSVVQISHCTYRLGRLAHPVGLVGAARLARADEVPLVARWLDEFHDEALAHDPWVDPVALARQRIDDREVWCWTIDETPVAMAACSQAAAGVARIGPVYTPPDQRGNGYAAGVTAAAAQGALERGAEHVMLYADRSNLTSNALYRRLGFEPDHDAEDLGFRPPG
jgi:RimJ/RimL family protein N-acetyltransferase